MAGKNLQQNMFLLDIGFLLAYISSIRDSKTYSEHIAGE